MIPTIISILTLILVADLYRRIRFLMDMQTFINDNLTCHLRKLRKDIEKGKDGTEK